jgi:hypothetical protein
MEGNHGFPETKYCHLSPLLVYLDTHSYSQAFDMGEYAKRSFGYIQKAQEAPLAYTLLQLSDAGGKALRLIYRRKSNVPMGKGVERASSEPQLAPTAG